MVRPMVRAVVEAMIMAVIVGAWSLRLSDGRISLRFA